MAVDVDEGAGPAHMSFAAGRRSLRATVLCHAVLGRFLHSLNKFAHEEYGLEFDICDYEVYEFAKVWPLPAIQRWYRCPACNC